jgi:hypothetical protein
MDYELEYPVKSQEIIPNVAGIIYNLENKNKDYVYFSDGGIDDKDKFQIYYDLNGIINLFLYYLSSDKYNDDISSKKQVQNAIVMVLDEINKQANEHSHLKSTCNRNKPIMVKNQALVAELLSEIYQQLHSSGFLSKSNEKGRKVMYAVKDWRDDYTPVLVKDIYHDDVDLYGDKHEKCIDINIII